MVCYQRTTYIHQRQTLIKAMVKQATKRATCFTILQQDELKSDVARFTSRGQTCLVTNRGVAICVIWILTSDWIITRESRHTWELCYLFQVCLGAGKTPNINRVWCERYNYSLLSVTTFRNIQQPDLLQDRFDSWAQKTQNIAIWLVLQQCGKRSCTLCCPF